MSGAVFHEHAPIFIYNERHGADGCPAEVVVNGELIRAVLNVVGARKAEVAVPREIACAKAAVGDQERKVCALVAQPPSFARHKVKIAAGVGLVIPLDQLFGAEGNPAGFADGAGDAESTG